MHELEKITDKIESEKFKLVKLNQAKLNQNDKAFLIINKLDEVLKELNGLAVEIYFNEPITKNHYAKLNGTVDLSERWEINEKIYNEFLNMLPPLRFAHNKFIMCEFKTGNITTEFFIENDKYYCHFIEFKG